MQSKNALSNLKNRYVAVLKKCALINIFGTLAVATMLVSPFMASEALASSMQASASNPVLNNNGTLTGDMFSVPSDFKAAMYGYHATGTINYLFTNYGNITVTSGDSTSAYGMYAEGDGNHSFSNYSTINVNATGSALTSGSTYAYGMYTEGDGNHVLNNYGTINVTVTGGTGTPDPSSSSSSYNGAVVYGMYLSGKGDSTLSNYGTITAIAKGGTINSTATSGSGDSASATSRAIRISNGVGNLTVNNYNTINATATAGTAISSRRSNSDVEADGIEVSGDANSTSILNNFNLINVTATGGKATSTSTSASANATASATGMGAGNGNITLSNSGTINVNATGGTSTAVNSTNSTSTAYGMTTSGTGSHTLTNSGTINVKATGGKASSTSSFASASALAQAIAYGMSTGSGNSSTLSNSGTINVTAIGGIATIGGIASTSSTSAAAYAYGMYLYSSSGISTVNNTGIINAKASVQQSGANTRAFEVYGGGSYSVGTWATTLRDWAVHDSVFGANTGKNVNFANSTLILRPGTEAQNFAFGKEYTVANMVSIGDGHSDMAQQVSGSGNVLGNISEVKTEVPFLKATLNGSVANTATVKLEANINEKTTPGATTMQQAVAQVQSQFTNISASLRKNLVNLYTNANLIAQNENIGMAAGSDMMSQNKWQIFLTPYISKVDNSDFDYDGNNSGIIGGLTYNVSEAFSLGAHLDFNEGNYSADTYNMDIDSTSLAFGLHANYNIMPQWYVRTQVTASISENDVDYTINPAVSAQSDYAGKALYAELATGYTFQFGKSHFLTPELGFSYLSAHIDDYDINWTFSAYNMQYDSSSYNALYANFNLDWRSEWYFDNNQALSILAGAGVRQKLTSDDIESQLSLYGTNFTTKNSEDDTVFLADFGLEYKIHDFSLSLNYSGEYGSSQQVHKGYATLKYMF